MGTGYYYEQIGLKPVVKPWKIVENVPQNYPTKRARKPGFIRLLPSITAEELERECG